MNDLALPPPENCFKMKFAAIATDQAILPVLRAVEVLPGSTVEFLWTEEQELSGNMKATSSSAKSFQNWDELLTRSEIDYVLVAGVSESVLSAARQLLNAGHKILVVVSTSGAAARVFDYTALWQEASDRVLPVFLSGMGTIVKSALRQFDEENYGRLWRVDFTRTITKTEGKLGSTLEVAQQWFLQDCSWLREIDPHANLVTMTTTGPNQEFPSEVSIRLSGENAIESRWSIDCGANERWQLSFLGEERQLTIKFQQGAELSVDPEGAFSSPACDDYLIDDIRRQLQVICEGKQAHDWTDVIKLGEFGATANRSLQRRRTYPVHFEEASERSQFKSQMAAIGCGALLWAMFGMISLLALGAISDPRDREYLTSSSADYVIWNEEFTTTGQLNLTAVGQDHLREIAAGWSSTSPVVIVELPDDEQTATEELIESRKRIVLDQLQAYEIKNAEQRLVLRPIQGQWFETAMLFGWIVVFSPVGLVLLAQVLLLVSRPVE